MEATIPQARMPHPAFALPGAMHALQALGKAVTDSDLPPRTLELMNLRASQINGCGVCAVQHPSIARKLGETDERLFAVAAWREAPYFDDAERAALALTEAATRISDRAEPVATRSGKRLPATTTSKRSQRWSSRSPTSTSGPASTW